MTDKEAMKLALDALETLMIERGSIYEKAIAALKERLAQQEQEPVAWLDPWTRNNVTTDYDAYGNNGIPLYTTPAQRTWVGLTNQEQLDIFAQSVAKKRSDYEHYKAIEQALKEKN